MTWDEVDETLRELRDLKQNWDSYGADPISEIAIDVAYDIFGGREGDAPTSIAPLSQGGVLIEWEGDLFDIMVEVDYDGDVEISVFDE